jgi:hypothetical protein
MNKKESYDYMVTTLSGYYFQTHDNELGGILGGLDTTSIGKPFDPAAWVDWVKAIRIITSNEVDITQSEANKAIIELLKEYSSHGFKLEKVIKYVNEQLRAH